ncbi:hypothetical protein SAMN04488113_1279 [Alkalibacterium gilvum]|uniref:Uncharacterized protein n=1 Tax=Alkalibacterium gilvum TaxID=1130080 RepID=A0A1H6U373_9LACT|nr:hypothetical protein [Alkalibacterium gilvum]SEI86721.1 hypothetical protein SAMN04488113_1279 [Alkalibacterium gilvum]
MTIENMIQLIIAIVPAVIAYLGAVYQYKNKLELVREQNKTELDKVIKQLEEERYKTDKEIEKLKLEKDNDIERIEAETNKEISVLQAQYETKKDETLENKLWEGMGDDLIKSFKNNFDLDKLMKDEIDKNI